MMVDTLSIGDFTDDEIKKEYVERFGDPADPDLSDYMASDLIDELERRGKMPDPEPIDGLDEIADLIAEAARISAHARRAYALLRDLYPEILPELAGRQRLIAGRMGDVA